MNLCRLVYYSERDADQHLDLRTLIAQCHKNNTARSVTGLLHHNGTYFIQVLEGSRADVSSIYHRIATDPRHINLILLSCSDVRERLFPTWSMGLHEGTSPRTREIFLRYFSKDRIDPETISVDSLLDVLQDVAAEL